MIERDELPIGFTMELAMNPEAMSRFSGLTEPEQKQVVNRARNITSRNPWNFQEETAAPMGMETFLK